MKNNFLKEYFRYLCLILIGCILLFVFFTAAFFPFTGFPGWVAFIIYPAALLIAAAIPVLINIYNCDNEKE